MIIRKILIANRGEVALRIIRTAKEMGIKTVALCPRKGQESNFLETGLADEFYYLENEDLVGYLDAKKIIEIAKKSQADAIHPGFGFLAENWKFAHLCNRNRIKFIGPRPEHLKALEDKIEAKKIALRAKIPIIPSSDRPIKSKKDLFKWIKKIEPPFILKAEKGGGGMGIRVVNDNISFGDVLTLAVGVQKQMKVAFGESDFFIEKYLPLVRHIEVQILADGKNYVHLGERDCTIQRRFQKLFEESPSSFLEDSDREKLFDYALRYMRMLKNYQGAATVEFLADENKNFYFMEVNPRLQVEHPITEARTGIDIVKQQIKIANGEKLPFSQEEIKFENWALEARINSEDPAKNFQPFSGKISRYIPCGGQNVFVHTFIHDGQEIYPYFDSLLLKLIAIGKTRSEAIKKLKQSLGELIIEGVPTTIPFFKILLEDKNFLNGNFYTNFIEKSGILEKVWEKKYCQSIIVPKKYLTEEELAGLIFQIYDALKKEIRGSLPGIEKSKVSLWQKAERYKMFE